MSSLTPYKIPPGIQVIKCTAYPDRVADLSRANPNGAVIGLHYEGCPNQLWTFSPQGTTKLNKISTTAASGARAFTNTGDPSAGDVVYGSSAATAYAVATTDGGNYTISIESRTEPLFWTLASGNEGTKVTLQPANGTATQIWSIDPPSRS